MPIFAVTLLAAGVAATAVSRPNPSAVDALHHWGGGFAGASGRRGRRPLLGIDLGPRLLGVGFAPGSAVHPHPLGVGLLPGGVTRPFLLRVRLVVDRLIRASAHPAVGAQPQPLTGTVEKLHRRRLFFAALRTLLGGRHSAAPKMQRPCILSV